MATLPPFAKQSRNLAILTRHGSIRCRTPKGKEPGVAMVSAAAIFHKHIARRKLHSIAVRNDVPVEIRGSKVHSMAMAPANMHVCMRQASIQLSVFLTSEVMQMLAWPWKAPWVCSHSPTDDYDDYGSNSPQTWNLDGYWFQI